MLSAENKKKIVELMEKESSTVCVAIYANEAEYLAIRPKFDTDQQSYLEHCMMMTETKRFVELNGGTATLVECDLEGYKRFLKSNKLLAGPHSVSLYVNAKFNGVETLPGSPPHVDIEIHRKK